MRMRIPRCYDVRYRRSVRGVIFDMDGVLVLSEPFIAEAAIRMFAEKGHQIGEDEFRPFIGMGEDRFIGGVAERRGIALDPARDKARTYAIYDDLVRGRLHPTPGAREFVRACRAKGLAIAVASGGQGEGRREPAGARPSRIGVRRGHRRNPGRAQEARARHLPGCLPRLALAPADCLVVEDALSGVQAAKAAGARCLGLTTSFDSAALAAADWTAPDLAHVPEAALDW